MYTNPSNYLATRKGKWSMKQLEVILTSRIPSLIGNKFKNHILKILNFSSLFRVFIPFPNALGPVSYPNKQSFLLIASQLFWVCCASLLLCSSGSSVAPSTFQSRPQLQRATRVTSKEQAYNTVFMTFLTWQMTGPTPLLQ